MSTLDEDPLPDLSGESLRQLLLSTDSVLAAAIRRAAGRDEEISYAAFGSTPLPVDRRRADEAP